MAANWSSFGSKAAFEVWVRSSLGPIFYWIGQLMHEFDASFASWENFGLLNVEFAGQSQRGIIAAWNQISAACFHHELG